ncbi:MAG: sugar phosphate isomerase/epimerase [Verrucomicrobiota bacterium JB022]|nr:sugar phosphate isomerase/epimerase [Verrucomicrobiota bacterium JB022]
MQIDQIGVQFFTLRDHCKTREAFIETCLKVAEIGYRAVQISAIDRSVICEPDIAAICADHGLTICATHEAGADILERPAEVVKRLQALDCAITAYPYPAGIDFGDEASVAALIQRLDAAGEVLAEAGQVLTYHNHQHEFRRLHGRLVLERIYAESGARNLQGEIDTYWVQYGGGDPVDWCRRLRGRLPIIHLKDFRINSEAQIEYAEVGAGNLNVPAIIEAAEASGCQWFVVEQDSCPGNPFDSIAQSFAYLKTLAAHA